MPFARWLRASSEHYLMVAAQQKMAAKYQVYGITPPPRPRGAEWFWLRVYVPAYQAVPWPAQATVSDPTTVHGDAPPARPGTCVGVVTGVPGVPLPAWP